MAVPILSLSTWAQIDISLSRLMLLPVATGKNSDAQRFFFGLPPLGGDHQFQIVNLNFISLPLDGKLTQRNMIIYGCEIPT